MNHVFYRHRNLFRQPDRRSMVEFFTFVSQKPTVDWMDITLITGIDMRASRYGRFLKFLC